MGYIDLKLNKKKGKRTKNNKQKILHSQDFLISPSVQQPTRHGFKSQLRPEHQDDSGL